MLLLDEPFSGLDNAQRRGAGNADRRAGRGGAGDRRRHPRPRPGPAQRLGALPQPPPDRLRGARRGARPRRRWKRPTAAPSSRSRAAAARRSCPPTITTTDARAAAGRASCSGRSLEIALIGLAGGAIGCWVVLYELSYAAESLAHSIFPGLVLAALAGVPLLLGATPAIVIAALAIALAARAPGTSRDVARRRGRHDDVRPRRAAGALAGLAAGDRGAAVRRHPRARRRRPDRRRRAGAGAAAGALAAAPAAAGERLRPRLRPRARHLAGR